MQELSRRTDTLIRLVEKEQEDYDAVDADEPKVPTLRRLHGRLSTCTGICRLLVDYESQPLPAAVLSSHLSLSYECIGICGCLSTMSVSH